MKLKFKKLHPNAQLPVYGTEDAAGMDFHACLDEPLVLHPGEAASIPTGLAMELPKGTEAQIRGRSGLAFKHAIFSYNGTIDADYRGEIRGLLINHSKVPFTIYPGMRIAQMVVYASYVKCRPEWTTELGETERGEKGFGSTGLSGDPSDWVNGTEQIDPTPNHAFAHMPLPSDDNPGYVRYTPEMGDAPVDQDVVKDQLKKWGEGKR